MQIDGDESEESQSSDLIQTHCMLGERPEGLYSALDPTPKHHQRHLALHWPGISVPPFFDTASKKNSNLVRLLSLTLVPFSVARTKRCSLRGTFSFSSTAAARIDKRC